MISGYTYLRPLGTGGFAEVFLYEQNMPRRQVAVKVLLDSAVNTEVLKSFTAEADRMARLSSHPSILTVYQASISADGRPFIVMEYCPVSFGATFRRGTIGVDTVLNAGVKIASALESVHRVGLLHRDIKPSNILVSSFGAPVLSDFGIAIATAAATEEVTALSLPWAAPEVIEQRTVGTVQSEIWSLAATLYGLLAGRSPFESHEAAQNAADKLQNRILKAAYTPILRPDMPPILDQVLAKALSKEASQRPQTMAQFAQELQWVQQQIGLMPTPLEVATDEWAVSAAELAEQEFAPRGPVISTVATASPRQRALGGGEATVIGAGSAPAASSGRGPLIAAIAVGLVAVGAVAALILMVVL